MNVLVRQIATAFYWSSQAGWVQTQDVAEVFADTSAAIEYCVSKGMRDVELVLSFDDPRHDVIIHPFGEEGNEPTSGELIEQSQTVKETSKEMTERSKDLLAGTHQTIAELKERKKRLQFKSKDVREE